MLCSFHCGRTFWQSVRQEEKNEKLIKYFKRSSSNEDEIKKLRQENDELIKIINERNLVTNDRGTFLSTVVQFKERRLRILDFLRYLLAT